MLTNKHRKVEESEESLIQLLTSKYLPYWPLFLLAIFVAVGIGYVYLRYTIPIYEADATIIIKDQKKGNEDSKLMESLDLISSNKIVENEIEIIQSRTLMLKVVKALFLYAPVFEQGQIHSVSAYFKSPIIIEAPNPDSIQEFDQINFSYDKNKQTVLLDHNHKYAINQIVNTPYGRLKFVPNKYYNNTKDTVKKQLYFSLSDPTDVAQGFLQKLKSRSPLIETDKVLVAGFGTTLIIMVLKLSAIIFGCPSAMFAEVLTPVTNSFTVFFFLQLLCCWKLLCQKYLRLQSYNNLSPDTALDQ